MKIGFDGRYIFENKGGVAGLRQYSTRLLATMADIAPANTYLLYLRHPVLPQTFAASPLVGQSSLHSRVVAGRLKKLPTAVWFQTALPNALRRDQLDLLHCPDFLAPFWNFGRRIPTIITIHDLNVLRFPSNFTGRTYWAWRLQAQISSIRAALILTDSQASKQDIIRLLKVPAHKIRVTLAAADPGFAPSPAAEIARIKTKYGLEQYIFWVGSLMPQKNLERLLRAFALLKKNDSIPYKLLLGGQSAWGSQPYHSLISELGLEGEVLLPGFIPSADLAPLYSGADLFIFPSLYEGFGLPPLEAMACGTPVAVSNVSSMPEVTGEAAVYFDPLNTASIAATMQRVLSDPSLSEELKNRGIARAAMFSWNKTAQETLAAYESLVTLRRHGVHEENSK